MQGDLRRCMTEKQLLIESIMKIAPPGNVDTKILDYKDVSELEAIYDTAREHQEDELLQERAKTAARSLRGCGVWMNRAPASRNWPAYPIAVPKNPSRDNARPRPSGSGPGKKTE